MAHPLAIRLAAFAILASAMGGEVCAAQSAEPPAPTSGVFSARQIMLPDEFRIEGESSRGHRFQILRADAESWTAILELGGQIWIAQSRDCRALEETLDVFRHLPPIYPGPYDLRDNPQPRHLGPNTPHAQDWTLRLAGFAPDHSHDELEIRGSQGPYPRWATNAVEAIKSCGPPAP